MEPLHEFKHNIRRWLSTKNKKSRACRKYHTIVWFTSCHTFDSLPHCLLHQDKSFAAFWAYNIGLLVSQVRSTCSVWSFCMLKIIRNKWDFVNYCQRSNVYSWSNMSLDICFTVHKNLFSHTRNSKKGSFTFRETSNSDWKQLWTYIFF